MIIIINQNPLSVIYLLPNVFFDILKDIFDFLKHTSNLFKHSSNEIFEFVF